MALGTDQHDPFTHSLLLLLQFSGALGLFEPAVIGPRVLFLVNRS